MLTLEKNVLKTVTFVCVPKINAKKVFLAGDFNQWQPQTKPMTKSKDGSYRASVKLPPGEYQYKFVVDGVWFNDPQAESQVINRHGTLNSVIRVK
jgi:1,4-alpha-glucan branching enzyme